MKIFNLNLDLAELIVFGLLVFIVGISCSSSFRTFMNSVVD